MMPDASKYYVSNFVDSTISVVDMSAPQHVTKTINLLENYDPITGAVTGPIGAFPVQTPVVPTGKYAVQANTLTATITFIDTDTDTLVKSLPCDYGCHGANFGAKKGGGYLLYISSKFANTMTVVDPDPNNDGSPVDANDPRQGRARVHRRHQAGRQADRTHRHGRPGRAPDPAGLQRVGPERPQQGRVHASSPASSAIRSAAEAAEAGSRRGFTFGPTAQM